MDEMNKETKSFKDAVQEKIGYQKQVIITFPIKVFNRLNDYAKDNTNHCYWLAIERLLDKVEELSVKDLNTIMLMERDDILRKDITKLHLRIDELEKQKEQEPNKRHFGKDKKGEKNE